VTSRGRGKSIGTIVLMRPGLGVMTTVRSPTKMASQYCAL
jgi:hypothetical protein